MELDPALACPRRARTRLQVDSTYQDRCYFASLGWSQRSSLRGQVRRPEGQLLPAFKLPEGIAFDIPGEWWEEAGMTEFRATHSSYECDGTQQAIVPIHLVASPPRHVVHDHGGFARPRLVRALIGIRTRTPLPPVTILDLPTAGFPYLLNDGFHRFRGSIAAGFSHIPVVFGWHPDLDVPRKSIRA